MGKTLTMMLALALAGCLWHPPGDGARPGMGLAAVERASPGGGSAGLHVAGEPGTRGYLFTDSLIAFRTRVRPGSVRFRLWNRGDRPVRVLWPDLGVVNDAPEPPCPDSARGWALRGSASPGEDVELLPGESAEGHAVLAVRVRTAAGETWQASSLPCLVFDPAEPRAGLRLEVETAGLRHRYTFWYRLVEPPREDGAPAPVASRDEAGGVPEAP